MVVATLGRARGLEMSAVYSQIPAPRIGSGRRDRALN